MAELIDPIGMSLRIILECEEEGVPPIGARLAQRLGRSAPTVSRMIERMTRDGLVVIDARRRLELTVAGRRRATSVLRKHRLAEVLLVRELGVPYEQAHAEADRFQHALTDRAESLLYDRLGRPALSPYGNPIPGLSGLGGPRSSRRRPRGEHPLADADHPGRAVVTRIAESAQEDAELLSALRAGRDVEFRPASDGVLVTAAGAEVRLPYAVARGIHVVEAARPSVRKAARTGV
ncbi:metal-dependent transcriptional regulator [Actinoplanes sp. Pm04-4]|uniref:Metal-dependent transcriptional regulator n=1 Tax=Paractinoplanes pyxinae TaxID=2997416 RepID=A0ABT4AV21_9ACTN|nr:metal-dependent transcriptional regulator [Actinoplanes pyxinae]MCY1138091.1 metal-dependent transcriptional regulator [Actinoplanes pyxinae]